MRFYHLIKGDVRFINKYGISFIYIAFTIVYLVILSMITGNARQITATILIYTDPAAMGLFFMGAFIMLEKSQRVNCTISVTPITLKEYIFSKVISLLVPGTIVGGCLCLFAAPQHFVLAVPAIMSASALFSLCGLICAVNSKSLNGFLIEVIPFEILICLPAILYLFHVLQSDWWLLHPGVAAIHLIMGDYRLWYCCFISMILWLVPVYLYCKKSVKQYFCELGGGKII